MVMCCVPTAGGYPRHKPISSGTDITIGIFLYAIEALNLENTFPLKFIEKNSKRCFWKPKCAMSYGWWVPETHSITPSATDMTIGIFLYALEALDLGHTTTLKFL